MDLWGVFWVFWHAVQQADVSDRAMVRHRIRSLVHGCLFHAKPAPLSCRNNNRWNFFCATMLSSSLVDLHKYLGNPHKF